MSENGLQNVHNLKRISVLYVDDEEDLLEISQIFLEKSGDFKVKTMVSAREALDSSDLLSFDAIVSDYQMPDIDGIGFLKAVRSLSPDIPFILFTGRGREEVVIEAINNGADFYLQKGGNPRAQFAELMHKIRQVVRRRQAESELFEQRIFSDAIRESIPGMLYVYDESGHLVEWNKNHELVTGFSAEELKGKSILDWFDDPDDIAAINAGIERTLREGYGDAEAYIRVKDGRKIPYYFTAVRAELGEKRYFTGIGIDITPLKKAEADIRDREGRYRRFAMNAPDMIYRFDIHDQQFEYVSPASLLLTGYNPDDFYHDHALADRILHPSWKEIVRKKRQILLEEKKTQAYEYQIIDRGGKIRWFNERNVLVIDEGGDPVAIEGIVTDVTDIKQADEDLRRSQERFSAVTMNAGSWIWEVDTHGIYQYSSPAVYEILGYKPEEIVGILHYYDLFDPSVRDELTETTMKVFASHEPFKKFENLNRHKDGTSVLLSTTGTPFFNEKGELKGYWGVDEDITDLVTTHTALRQTTRKLSMLASVARHDILNKLTVIKGYLAVIQMDFDDPVLNDYVRAMKTATSFIQSQIEFTRTYKDLGTLEPVWIDVKSVIPLPEKPGEITFVNELPVVVVFADPMFDKVFLQLFENSVRHGQHVTRIHLSASEEPGGLKVIWKDNGIGIPDDKKEAIFERFSGETSGVGLFLAREILSLTGITIKETGVSGKCARFELFFPRRTYRFTSVPEEMAL